MYEAPGGTNGAARTAARDGAIAGDRKVGALARARHAMLSDDRLAKQAAGGDIGAFEAIFSRYGDDLYRFCVGILREPQDAQDAVQNTMIKAMRALPGERRAMQLKPWLYRIAHNEAVELRRRERLVEELPVTVDDVGALTDERAEENGRLRTLLADIADLPERQRASLVLREVNGLGFGEIGDALGTSPGAVRQALYEARRALAEMDHGRDMRCDAATRMVSDADGRPRDRGVRAHLRDCSPCRRFQTEIKDRSHALAAISPMPVLAAAGALKMVLGGSGATAGGAGAAVAGGAGAGAGAAGVGAGSVAASALLKPAVGLLTVLAIGTATVDRGAIFAAGRGEPATAAPTNSAAGAADPAEGRPPRPGHLVSARAATRQTPVRTRERAHLASARATRPTPAGLAPVATAEAPTVATIGPRSRADGEAPTPEATAPATVPKAPPLAASTHAEAVAPTITSHAAEAPAETPPGQAKKEAVPPGQAKKEAAATTESPTTTGSTTAATTEAEASTHVPPGQLKKETAPPGQAKKQEETTPEPTASEAPAPAAVPAETATHVPPGQANKEEAPPGQAKKEEAPPGQAKKEVGSAPAAESSAAAPDAEATEPPAAP